MVNFYSLNYASYELVLNVNVNVLAAEDKAGSTPTPTPAPSLRDLDVTNQIEEGTDDITVKTNQNNFQPNLDDLLCLAPPPPPPPQSDPDNADKFDYDWWSKYYYSIDDERRTQKLYVEKNLDRVKVYPGELEEAFNRWGLGEGLGEELGEGLWGQGQGLSWGAGGSL